MLPDDAKIIWEVWSNRQSNILQQEVDKMQQLAGNWPTKFNRCEYEIMRRKGVNIPDCEDRREKVTRIKRWKEHMTSYQTYQKIKWGRQAIFWSLSKMPASKWTKKSSGRCIGRMFYPGLRLLHPHTLLLDRETLRLLQSAPCIHDDPPSHNSLSGSLQKNPSPRKHYSSVSLVVEVFFLRYFSFDVSIAPGPGEHDLPSQPRCMCEGWCLWLVLWGLELLLHVSVAICLYHCHKWGRMFFLRCYFYTGLVWLRECKLLFSFLLQMLTPLEPLHTA